ncbi:MAG: histidine phosphatase family protein [Acidobacteriota bacterium]
MLRASWLAPFALLFLLAAACGAPATDSAPESDAAESETNAPTATEGEESTADGGEELSPGEQANADFEDQLSGADLLAALNQGGHVIYFRHAQTVKDYADQADPNMSLDDCESQRKLSEAGIQDAKDIGAAFTAQEIPVGQVISSQYCRAWQTAELAFGRYEQDPKLNFLPFEDYTEEQWAQMKANVTPLMTAVPEAGTNTVLVGHDDLFESATGIYPEPQGIGYVLTPDGEGGFSLVANVLPAEWAQLGG